MQIKNFLVNFFNKVFFSSKWRCNICGKEIFNEGYFCEDCKNKLPFNNKAICLHCGRSLKVTSNYCLTCKDNLTALDECRSVFNYSSPIDKLIKQSKYNNKKYILEIFIQYLTELYCKNLYLVDYICYVPMTEKSLKKRGYNQSEILARGVSEKIKIPVKQFIKKNIDTFNQAKLNRKERLKNLKNAFTLQNKSEIENKKILIIDDVTTTGATGEAIAELLKSANANKVYLLSVASVCSKEQY